MSCCVTLIAHVETPSIDAPPAAIADQRFIKAQENAGVTVICGAFKRKERRCLSCCRMFKTFEEKQTDVNVALRLFQSAVQDKL